MRGTKAAVVAVSLIIAAAIIWLIVRLVMGFIAESPRALMYALGGGDEETIEVSTETPDGGEAGYAVSGDGSDFEAEPGAENSEPDEPLAAIPVDETPEQLAAEAGARGD